MAVLILFKFLDFEQNTYSLTASWNIVNLLKAMVNIAILYT